MTYDQIHLLSYPRLVQLMLRYHMHYKALETHRLLNLEKPLYQKILVHWACCKVDQPNKSEDEILQELSERLDGESDVQYIDIAYRAVQVSKLSLAQNILEKEPSKSKRVPLYLWMANYSEDKDIKLKYLFQALTEALEARDSNLIHLTQMKMLKCTENQETGLRKDELFKILTNKHKDFLFDSEELKEICVNHMVSYLKIFDQTTLQRFYQYESSQQQAPGQQNFSNSAFYAIEQGNSQSSSLSPAALAFFWIALPAFAGYL